MLLALTVAEVNSLSFVITACEWLCTWLHSQFPPLKLVPCIGVNCPRLSPTVPDGPPIVPVPIGQSRIKAEECCSVRTG